MTEGDKGTDRMVENELIVLYLWISRQQEVSEAHFLQQVRTS